MSSFDAAIENMKKRLEKEKERLETPSDERIYQAKIDKSTTRNTRNNRYVPASPYGSRSTASFGDDPKSWYAGKRHKSKSRSKKRKHKKRHQTRKHKK